MTSIKIALVLNKLNAAYDLIADATHELL